MVDLVIMNEVAKTFTNTIPYIILAELISSVITIILLGDLKRKFFNFLKIPYYELEFIHDGSTTTEIIKQTAVVDGKYRRNGVDIFLNKVFNPIQTSRYSKRYSFKNENVFPLLNSESPPDAKVKYSGINSYEVLMKGKGDTFFIMTDSFMKKLLSVFFVEKIKKEKEDFMTKVLEFLQTGNGTIVLIAIILLILLQVYSAIMK